MSHKTGFIISAPGTCLCRVYYILCACILRSVMKGVDRQNLQGFASLFLVSLPRIPCILNSLLSLVACCCTNDIACFSSAMSNPESPESLHELPQPYDISEAVAQALRIKSSSSACDESSYRPARRPTKRTTSEIKEREDDVHKNVSQTTEEAYEDLIPELGADSLLDEVFDNLPLPDMDTDAWSERIDSNREELERFCKFIGGEDEEYTLTSSKTRSRQKRAVRSPAKPDCARQLQIALPPTAVSSYAHPVVELVNAQLWREFSSIGTEMVITKNGR